MAALLYFLAHNKKDMSFKKGTVKSLKRRNLSAIEFSEAYSKGELSELTKQDPIVTHLVPLLTTLDDCVQAILRSPQAGPFNNQSFDQLLSALQWRNRLQTVGQMDVFCESSSGSLPKVSDVTLSSLKIHYKWLNKWLLPELIALIRTDLKLAHQNEHIIRLKKIISTISSSLSASNSCLRHLSKIIAVHMGQPLPLADQNQADITLKISKYQNILNINEECHILGNICHLAKKVQVLLSSKGIKCRLMLANAIDQLEEKNYSGASALLVEIEDKLLDPSIDDPDQNTTVLTSDSEINLWPLKCAIFSKLNTACTAVLTTKSIKTEDKEVLLNSLHWCEELPCISPNIVGWMKYIYKGLESSNHPKFNLMLTAELMQQFTELSPLKNPIMWLTWNSQIMKDKDEDMFMDFLKVKKFSSESPLVSIFLTYLIASDHLTTNDNIISTPLKSYKDRTILLNEIKNLIWRNSPAFGSRKLNNRINEEKSIRNEYTNFLSNLIKSLVSKGFLEESECISDVEDIDSDIILSALKSFIKTKCSKITWTWNKTYDTVIESLIRLIKDVSVILNKLKTVDNEPQRMMLIGQAWVFLGLILLIFFTCIDVVDPVHKNAIKLEYARKEQEDLKRILTVEELQGIILGSDHFPYHQVFTERVASLKAQEERLEKYIAIRPDLNSYTQLSKEMNRLTLTICSPIAVVNLVTKLIKNLESLDISEGKICLKEVEGWLSSIKFVFTSTAKFSIWFPDIVSTILLALNQLTHGVRILYSRLEREINLHELNFTKESLLKIVEPLVYCVMPEIRHAQKLVDICSSKQIINFINKVQSEGENNVDRNQIIRLSKCCLQELYNIVSVKGNLQDGEEWKSICQILDHVVLSWQKQEEIKKEKEQQEENLYINKTRAIENLTEEEEISLEIATLFPSYQDKDFSDLELPTLEDSKKTFIEDKNANVSLTLVDIKEIHRIHSEITTLNTSAHWINAKTKDNMLDFVSPFSERFSIFSQLLNSFHGAFDGSLDAKIGPALCMAIDLAMRKGYCNKENEMVGGKNYDFYHNANISEVKQSINLFDGLNKRVKELLQEWPDHPTLNQIIMIIERILAFEVTSPVSRFLTGFELLLTKIKEWEENAHSGVSLSTHSASITHQIIAWRKLELSCWKGCFNSSAQRICSDTSKWWFHLYSLTSSYLSEKDDSLTDSQLISSLESFMELSALGEFQTRLNLLYSFHCHVINLSGIRQEKLVSVLWNLYQYYQQFHKIIEQRIKESAAPIEKKLKDFIKICRWNDINYWSVKTTVEQTHRTLHKYIKEYENILKQPAKTAMTKLDQSQTSNDTPLNTEPDLYIASIKLKKILEDNEIKKSPVKTENILAHEMTLFSKARKLCREAITSYNVPVFIKSLNEFCEDIKETSIELNETSVDENLPKEKQKSQAKSVLHRKRKVLSDLFRTLADLGLSYRAGLVSVDELGSSAIKFATLPPLDVSAALSQIENRNADAELKSAWKGCEEYFLQSVAFVAQLDKALGKPHKDIGPPIIERCKGFTNNLMKYCQEQKLNAADCVEKLYLLRCQTTELFDALPLNTELPKHSSQLDALKDKLHTILDDIVFCLEQFQIFLNTCPEQDVDVILNQPTPKLYLLSESSMGPLLIGSKGDPNWLSAQNKLNDTIGIARKAKSKLQNSEKSCRFIDQLLKTNQNLIQHHEKFDVTTGQYKAIKDGFMKLDNVLNKITEVKDLFFVDGETFNSSNKPLEHLGNKIKQLIDEFKKTNLFEEELGQEWSQVMTRRKKAQLTTEVINNFEIDVESLLNTILIVVQEFYKRSTQNTTTKLEEINEEPSENVQQIVKGHLKEKIVNSLFSDVKNLKLNEVTESLWKLIGKLSTMQNSNNRQACKKILRRCIPLLDQYSLLAQFVITQQISALKTSSKLCTQLSTLCIDLALKGFRMPEELMEEGEGEGDKAGGEGMGLGEGEGKKDVSDQIESQDQLEDARPSGEEEKEEDKDCKEEEKGIEMSDDFGGKLQDIEKKDDENGSEDNSDEEEPDKEMGDTEKGADTLDQQIWGSDSEEEGEGEEDEKEEDKGDTGKQEGEKELGAHEDDKKPQPEEQKEEDGKHQDKEKEINEMDDKEVDDDQIDPHHGKHEPLPEPEAFDLPDDLNLDEDQKEDGHEDETEENPFDIDEMKEQMPPPEDNQEPEEEEGDKQDEMSGNSSDDEENNETEETENIEIDKEDEENEGENQDGGAKSDEKTGEEPKPDEENVEKKEDETAEASEDKPSSDPAMSANQDAGSKDKVSEKSQDEDKSKKMNPEDSTTTEGPDEQGVGMAQQEKDQEANEGSKGSSQTAAQSNQKEGREEKRQRPGESEEERALGNIDEPVQKKLKTMKMDQEGKEETEEQGIKEDSTAELYQHIKEAKDNKFDAQTLDAATEEQAQQQPLPTKEDENGEELKDDNNFKMDEDEPDQENEIIPKKTSDKLKDGTADKKSEGETNPNEKGDGGDIETGIEVEGEIVETMTAKRGDENTFHTVLEEMEVTQLMSDDDITNLRSQLEQQLASWSQPPPNEEAVRAWETLTNLTSSLSRELSEQLRLVLEPTHASRLKGDFRTGRRINMRKVIPYIASQFRKDKIWLRRTKPSKREYQIILAIDDSSSMADSHSKELAFESLAVVSKALSLLEAGDLSVLSFGESPKVLHQLGEPFMEHSGVRLLQQFSFEQQKTYVGALVDFACGILANAVHRSSSDIAQLLVIISDGRGVFNEGEDKVRQAVRRARLQGILMVFVIIDNPNCKDSILDIRMARFSGGKILEMPYYMDKFPFPFYLILRDINNLPSVLSDALRQWFELVTNMR